MYIFPGIGLGAALAQASIITDSMFQAGAVALSQMVSDEALAAGSVLPAIKDIRDVSANVAAALVMAGVEEGVISRPPPGPPSEWAAYYRGEMWTPNYAPIVPDAGR